MCPWGRGQAPFLFYDLLGHSASVSQNSPHLHAALGWPSFSDWNSFVLKMDFSGGLSRWRVSNSDRDVILLTTSTSGCFVHLTLLFEFGVSNKKQMWYLDYYSSKCSAGLTSMPDTDPGETVAFPACFLRAQPCRPSCPAERGQGVIHGCVCLSEQGFRCSLYICCFLRKAHVLSSLSLRKITNHFMRNHLFIWPHLLGSEGYRKPQIKRL